MRADASEMVVVRAQVWAKARQALQEDERAYAQAARGGAPADFLRGDGYRVDHSRLALTEAELSLARALDELNAG